MSRITGLKGSVAASGSEEPSGAASAAASGAAAEAASGAGPGLRGSKSAGASRRGLGMVCRARAWLKQLLSLLLTCVVKIAPPVEAVLLSKMQLWIAMHATC